MHIPMANRIKTAMKPRETIWNIMELYNLVGGLEHEFHFP